MSKVFSNPTVQDALELIRSMPAAVSMRGLTDFGFIINNEGNEVVDYVARANGIIKPGYWFITGGESSGESSGRKTITAQNIADAVAKFQEHPFWAQLKVTTGKGFRINGMVPELVDIAEADTQVVFEVTHFGGRSLVPQLSVKLGKMTVESLDWASGFVYTDERNNAPRRGSNLVLSRILLADDFASEESLRRVWEEISTEVMRLMMFNIEDKLPRDIEKSTSDRARVFVSQDLTALLPEIELEDQKPGTQYITRPDALSLQASLPEWKLGDEVEFLSSLKGFMDEAMRVYTLYCRPLTETQKQKAGRPTEVDTDLPDVKSISFERDMRRSTDRNEALIAWDDSRRSAPHFAYDGWQPEKDKTYRVICHTWGRGIRVSPAPATYVERLAQIGETKAEKQLVRVEFDGAESVVTREEIFLKSEKRFRVGTYWVSEAQQLADGSFEIVQTWTDYDELWREHVSTFSDRKGHIKWDRVEMTPVPKTRKFKPEKVWIEPVGLAGRKAGDEDWERISLVGNQYFYGYIIKLLGKDADDNDVEVVYKPKTTDGKGIAWNELPKNLRAEHGKSWPVCDCRRARYNAKEHDKCRLCRTHVTCTRCGEDRYVGEEKVQAGQTMCNSCVEKVQQEEWIMKHIGLKGLAKIRLRARRVFNAQLVSVETWRYGRKVPEDLYELDDGLYRSKGLSEDQIKGFLVRPCSDVIDWLKPLFGNKQMTEENIIGFAKKLDDFDFVEWARMSEASYQRVSERSHQLIARAEKIRFMPEVGWQKFDEWKKKLGGLSIHSHPEPVMESFNKVEEEIASFESKIEALNKLKALIDSAITEHKMDICPLCGSPIGKCEYHNREYTDLIRWRVGYDFNGEEVKHITPLARLTNERGEVLAEVRVSPGARHSQYDYGDTYLVRFPPNESGISDPADAEPWDGKTPFKEFVFNKMNLRKKARSRKEEQQIRNLRSRMADNNREIEKLLERAEREKADYDKAEADFVSRPSQYGASKIEPGTLFSTKFVYNDDKDQWETEVFWDAPSMSWVKLVVGSWENDQPIEGKEMLVWVKPKNSEQLHLFSYHTRDLSPDGKSQQVYGYFCQLVTSPEDLEDRIETLKLENESLQEELATLESEESDPVEGLVEEAVDKDGNPTTALGQALRDAGFFDED